MEVYQSTYTSKHFLANAYLFINIASIAMNIMSAAQRCFVGSFCNLKLSSQVHSYFLISQCMIAGYAMINIRMHLNRLQQAKSEQSPLPSMPIKDYFFTVSNFFTTASLYNWMQKCYSL